MIEALVFIGALILFAVISIVFEHHWRGNSMSKKARFFARVFYYGGSAILWFVVGAAFIVLV